MKRLKTTRYDVADYLKTPKAVAVYLETAIEEANGDAAFIVKALGNAIRAKGAERRAVQSGA